MWRGWKGLCNFANLRLYLFIKYRYKGFDSFMYSLLIVEDGIAYSTMMQTWLKKKGFDVDKVSSVGAAAKKIISLEYSYL